MAWQVQDAKAAHCTAEAIAAACQRELTQVSSTLASQLEAESMWQGRAQGLQQQLDQAMQDKQQLQQNIATLETAVGDRWDSVRCICYGLLSFYARHNIFLNLLGSTHTYILQQLHYVEYCTYQIVCGRAW